ncbi:MAG: hypothetical protein GW761_01455 [Leptospira sp.]|nr:hypothetical protein [Leptospira sp.]
MKKSAVVLFLFLSFPNFIQAKDDFHFPLEDMIFFEKIILDFYTGDLLKRDAISSLESRCRFKDYSSGLSCANLAILYNSESDLPRAYTAAALAYKKEPKDNYYRNLFQNLAVKSGNIKDLQRRMGKSGEIPVVYLRAVQACNEGSLQNAIGDIQILVKKKLLTKEQLQNGIFSECVSENPSLKKELTEAAISNPTSYQKLLEDEIDSSHSHKEIWDMKYARKELDPKIENLPEPNKKLTEIWSKSKIAILSGKSSQANTELSRLQSELKSLKSQGGKNKMLAESIELAVGLILKQDKDFAAKASKMGIAW